MQRSITGLYSVLKRTKQEAVKPPDPKYIPKPYEKMLFPGQRVHIYVKFVPDACLVGEAKGKKFYQYTTIYEYSSAQQKSSHCLRPASNSVGLNSQADPSYTTRHNGKVKRSHRKDNEYFYATHKFYSFKDFKNQLAVHNKNYNKFPMRPLNWRSPGDYINAFISSSEVF